MVNVARNNVDAFVLVPQDAKAGLDALLKYRSDVGVQEGNPYIFARMLSETPLYAHGTLREIMSMFPGLQKPEDVMSASLRKYVATVSQV